MSHSVNSQLSPAEALVLLKPNRPAALESVKVTLLWLSAQGLLRIEEETKRTFLGSKRIAWVQPTGRECAALWPEAASVMAVVSEAHACGGMLEYLAKRARHTYGNEFTGFLSQFIMPSLARRELLEERLVLRLFPKTYLTCRSRSCSIITGNSPRSSEKCRLPTGGPRSRGEAEHNEQSAQWGRDSRVASAKPHGRA